MLNIEKIITVIKKNKSFIPILCCAIILLIIIISIAIISITNNPQTTQEKSTPISKTTITPSFPTSTTRHSTPTPTSTEQKTTPPVHYDDAGQSSLLNKVEHRKSLSQSDLTVRNKLISTLPSGSGTLFQSTDVSIQYVSAPNVFQVEILTTSLDQAKKEANAWFLLQGFSQDAICNYPVQFYINFYIAQQLRGHNITFNPLAPGCI